MLKAIAVRRYVLAYSGFGLPVTLTLWHMLFCSVVSAALVKGGLVAPVQGMTFEIYKVSLSCVARHLERDAMMLNQCCSLYKE